MRDIFNQPLVWFVVAMLLLWACTDLPLRIKNDELRSFVMRWVLVPVSILIIVYVYPVGIEIFSRLALK